MLYQFVYELVKYIHDNRERTTKRSLISKIIYFPISQKKKKPICSFNKLMRSYTNSKISRPLLFSQNIPTTTTKTAV